MIRRRSAVIGALAVLALAGCATESSRTIVAEKTQAATTAYTGMTANAQHGGYPCYCNGSYWSPAGDISTACNW